jgi:hypothetical protein
MLRRQARLLGAVVASVAAAAVISACSSLRDGPFAATKSDDASAAADGPGAGGAVVGEEEDGSAVSDAEAERDPEWAMWRLPDPAPTAGNYAVANGVARDETTRLEWLQAALADPLTHAEAEAACAATTQEGGGFRLPTRIELLSLVDYSPNGKGMNTSVFGVSSFGVELWSSTPDALAPASRAWFVRFTNGESGTDSRGTMRAVRCVRGPAP